MQIKLKYVDVDAIPYKKIGTWKNNVGTRWITNPVAAYAAWHLHQVIDPVATVIVARDSSEVVHDIEILECFIYGSHRVDSLHGQKNDQSLDQNRVIQAVRALLMAFEATRPIPKWG